MELFDLDGRRWATGFVWDEPRVEKIVSHKVLKEEKGGMYDTFAQFSTPRGIQYGFGTVGKKRRDYVRANALATVVKNVETVKPPVSSVDSRVFIGLFKLKNPKGIQYWWLFVNIGGQIPKLGDSVFYERDEAFGMLSLMEKLTGITSGLSRVFETVEESEDYLREAVVYGFRDKYILSTGHLANLDKYVSRATVFKIAVLAVLCVLVFAAFTLPKTVRDKLALMASSESHKAMLQRRADAKIHPEKFFPMLWQNSMYPADVANFCLREMMAIPLSSNAWELSRASCNGKTLNIDWNYAEGATFLLPPEGASLDEKNPKVAHTNRNLKFDKSEVHRRPDGPKTSYTLLPTREKAIGLMSEITQSSLTRLNPLVFKPQDKKIVEKIPVVSPWHFAAWQLSNVPELLLDEKSHENGIFKMLADIPGLSISSITFSTGQGWTVKGDLYAKHK